MNRFPRGEEGAPVPVAQELWIILALPFLPGGVWSLHGGGIQDLTSAGQHTQDSLAVQLRCPRARAPFVLSIAKPGSVCSTKIPICASVLMGHLQLLQQGKMLLLQWAPSGLHRARWSPFVL